MIHVLGIEVEDDPLAVVLREGNRGVLLRGQAEVGRGSALGEDVGGASREAEAAGGGESERWCEAEGFAAKHWISPLGIFANLSANGASCDALCFA